MLTAQDNLQWKTTFVGRQTALEDSLRWKKTFSGRPTLKYISNEPTICISNCPNFSIAFLMSQPTIGLVNPWFLLMYLICYFSLLYEAFLFFQDVLILIQSTSNPPHFIGISKIIPIVLSMKKKFVCFDVRWRCLDSNILIAFGQDLLLYLGLRPDIALYLFELLCLDNCYICHNLLPGDVVEPSNDVSAWVDQTDG